MKVEDLRKEYQEYCNVTAPINRQSYGWFLEQKLTSQKEPSKSAEDFINEFEKKYNQGLGEMWKIKFSTSQKRMFADMMEEYRNQSHPVKTEVISDDGLQYANLTCLVNGFELNLYQKSLAKQEYEKLLKQSLPQAKPVVSEGYYEVLRVLLKESYNLKTHITDMGYIDWEDESLDGCKDFDSAINMAQEYLNKGLSLTSEGKESDVLMLYNFGKKLCEKHNTKIQSINIHFDSDGIYITDYKGNDLFKDLEFIEINPPSQKSNEG